MGMNNAKPTTSASSTATSHAAPGSMVIAEMREFASFPAGTQRYIRRSLDVGLEREDAVARWSRDAAEQARIRVQARVYDRLNEIRAAIPHTSDLSSLEDFMAPLIMVSAFDLGQDRLHSFGAYRFLYERLLGASTRPWLPAAFCAAASLPQLHPQTRYALLTSISETVATAPGWSPREPGFLPEWVDKVDLMH